jgi:hypothetical protein
VAIADLTPDEFERLFDEEAAGLDPDSWAVLDQYAVPTRRTVYEFQGVNGIATSPVWIVAQDDDTVLAYDEAEEEYGIGTLLPNGIVGEWGTFGAQLRWSVLRFPGTGNETSRPST